MSRTSSFPAAPSRRSVLKVAGAAAALSAAGGLPSRLWAQAPLKVAAVSTSVATVFGALIALALCRYQWKGAAPVNFLLGLPLTTPEVVLGSSLLSLFLQANVATGFWTIVIAHIMF